MYASYLAAVSRADEAVRESLVAHELDPFSLAIHVEAAWNSYMARVYERAAGEALRTLDLEPLFAPAHSTLGLVYEQTGRFNEAVTALEKARTAAEGHPATLAALAHALASAGRIEDSRVILEQMVELSRQQHVPPYWLALAHAGVDERDAALDALDRAYQQHDVWLVWLGTDPRFDVVRGEPRFVEILRRIGLTPRADSAQSGR
jgi:tetratricopeptide (TPR) repeat protein